MWLWWLHSQRVWLRCSSYQHRALGARVVKFYMTENVLPLSLAPVKLWLCCVLVHVLCESKKQKSCGWMNDLLKNNNIDRYLIIVSIMGKYIDSKLWGSLWKKNMKLLLLMEFCVLRFCFFSLYIYNKLLFKLVFKTDRK